MDRLDPLSSTSPTGPTPTSSNRLGRCGSAGARGASIPISWASATSFATAPSSAKSRKEHADEHPLSMAPGLRLHPPTGVRRRRPHAVLHSSHGQRPAVLHRPRPLPWRAGNLLAHETGCDDPALEIPARVVVSDQVRGPTRETQMRTRKELEKLLEDTLESSRAGDDELLDRCLIELTENEREKGIKETETRLWNE